MSEANENHAECIDLEAWAKRREASLAAETKPKLVSVDERRLEQLIRARIMLAAIVREQGRVRVRRKDLDKVTRRTKLDVRVQEGGDLVVTYDGE